MRKIVLSILLCMITCSVFAETRRYYCEVKGIERELGSVAGKDVVIIDDMISSGESMLDVAKQVKERGADHVFVCTTFGLFTDGLEKFDAYYEKGYISKVITTDLTYRTPELVSRPWYEPAEMSKYMASIIDTLNHDVSVAKVQSTTEKINKLLAKHR